MKTRKRKSITTARKKTSRPQAEVGAPVFVLVGPLADPKLLAKWAHEEFRKSSTVAFIGVDSGFAPLEASGLPPTFGIGDFDGDAAIEEKDVPLIRLERDKDRSDLSIALSFCIGSKAEIVYAFGFQGGRADHDLGVHLDLSEASLHIPRVVSVGEKGATFYLSARYSALELSHDAIQALRNAGGLAPKTRHSSTPKSENLVSIFPIGGEARGVKLRGLRFNPPGGILSSSSQGLSNEIRTRKIGIELKRGRLAVFFPT